MAKSAEEKKVEKLLKDLEKANVTVTGSETVEELEALLAKAKEDAKPEPKPEKNSTTFEFKNGGTRVFSKSVHGDKWEDLADEFQETNKLVLATRDGKDL